MVGLGVCVVMFGCCAGFVVEVVCLGCGVGLFGFVFGWVLVG